MSQKAASEQNTEVVTGHFHVTEIVFAEISYENPE